MNSKTHSVEQLVNLFNELFIASYNTELQCCEDEPVYKPANANYPHHRIIFAHGFFASALHEISHWCVAGEARRQLEDFGYWYEPDGRSEERQAEFEKVEIKPQALEWIFSVSADFKFHFSADNIALNNQPSLEFKQAVYEQVERYLHNGLPLRAKMWSDALIKSYHNNQAINIKDFIRP